MDISIQYLEDTPARANITPAEARGRLRDAFEHLPFKEVMLGWDLEPALIETCAEECARRGAELYLWQPILTGRRTFRPDPAWRVIALDGGPAGAADQPIEFTFMCPNRTEVLDRTLESIEAALSRGAFQGIFLDRIRLPSPSLGLERHFGCFCDACCAAAEGTGIDLAATREEVLKQLERGDERRAVLSDLLSATVRDGGSSTLLQRLMDFRARSITGFVESVIDALKGKGLKVGLDCFAPTFTRMVGQDLATLAGQADWIKVMTYARAFGHASLPFELIGLADWLVKAGGESEASALEALSQATGWPLPGLCDVIREGGLPASILTEELRRGRSQGVSRLLAGIELLEIPDVASLDRHQIRTDAEAVHAGKPDGVVLSWDLWHMPAWRLELAASLYGPG